MKERRRLEPLRLDSLASSPNDTAGGPRNSQKEPASSSARLTLVVLVIGGVLLAVGVTIVYFVTRSPSAPSTDHSATVGERPASSTSQVESKDVLLLDPDAPHDRSIVEKVAKAEQESVLHRVFPKYLTDQAQCRGDSANLADARAHGDIVPAVQTKVTGSFTVPKAEQTLYVVFVGECGATHADNWGSQMLVVLEHDVVVARAPMEGGASLQRALDLDGDGRHELVLLTGFTNQGSTIESAKLIRVDRSTLETVKDFGQVAEDNCASGLGRPSRRVEMIRATIKPGEPPLFRTEETKRPCH